MKHWGKMSFTRGGNKTGTNTPSKRNMRAGVKYMDELAHATLIVGDSKASKERRGHVGEESSKDVWIHRNGGRITLEEAQLIERAKNVSVMRHQDTRRIIEKIDA